MANDLNSCSFIGRAGGDPESRAAGSSTACNFSIAVGKSWTNKSSGQKEERTEWVRCTAFGKLGEICQNYITKGKQVYVSGELKTDKFQDKESGKDRYSTSIVLNNMQLLGGRDDTTAPQAQRQAPAGGAPVGGGSTDFSDEIPFAPYMHNTSA